MTTTQAWLPRAHVKFGAPPDETFSGSTGYTVTLLYLGRGMTVPFYMGPALTREPTASDVLSCLLSDASLGEQSFEDFCADLGYDEDSRQAEKTWKQCQRIADRLHRFLGSDYRAVEEAIGEGDDQ